MAKMVSNQTEKTDLIVEVNKEITSIYKLNIAQMYHSRRFKVVSIVAFSHKKKIIEFVVTDE